MKRIITCILLIAAALTANGQHTSLNEDFNTICASSSGFPPDWTLYNPLPATIPDGQWVCAPGEGRYGTAAIKCSGVYGTPHTYHEDTAFVITYAMNLSGDTGHVYLFFDSKVSNINLGARISMAVTNDSTKLDSVHGATELTGALTPVFGNDDSTDWVTHVADLTPFKFSTPLFVAFRYTSSNTTGSTWYIDNMRTSTNALGVTDPDRQEFELSVTGTSTTSSISLSFHAPVAGVYHLAVYDLMGRKVYREELQLQASQTTHTIHCPDLSPGMYLVKMTNGANYAIAKTVVK